MILIFSRSPQPDKISLSADIVCALAQKTCLKTLYNSFTLQKKKYHHSTFANSAETIQQRDRKKNGTHQSSIPSGRGTGTGFS